MFVVTLVVIIDGTSVGTTDRGCGGSDGAVVGSLDGLLEGHRVGDFDGRNKRGTVGMRDGRDVGLDVSGTNDEGSTVG